MAKIFRVIFIISIIAIVFTAINIYLNYEFNVEGFIGAPQLTIREMRAVVERRSMFNSARKYVRANSVPDFEFDLWVVKQAENWVLIETVPKNLETEPVGVILEKVDDTWHPRDIGTILPGWEEKVPELFE